MIQVLGLRDFRQGTSTKKRETFFNKGWRFNQIQDVFNSDKLNALLQEIPANEQFNLYFTVADCFEESGRKLKEQWAIPFDIDDLLIEEGMELKAAFDAASAASEVIGVPLQEMAVIFTGNGVQFFVLLDKPIISDDYFEATREGYGLICKQIQNKLTELGIQGKVDPSVWSKGRLMRLPLTLNRKPGRPERRAAFINGTMVPRSFDIAEISGVHAVETPEYISDTVLKNYPKPDTQAVCEGCRFLMSCKANPNGVSEPQWYAMTSITARLDDGRALTHAYSEAYHGYNHYETENKIDQALASSGPRTCKNIDSLWGECNTCEYYGKVTSPIMIKGEAYIASADFGYRERKVSKEGRVYAGKPEYQDLVKAFGLEHPHKIVTDNDQIIVFNGKHWDYMTDRAIQVWAMARIKHAPSTQEMREFLGQLKAFNMTTIEALSQQTEFHMNFKNCVLNLRTMETTPHAPEYGFFHVLPFDYDPRAEAPTWRTFLLDIMEQDEELVQLLEEYGGYCISGDKCWLHKAMMLIGEGANGKSVFMEVLGAVVGKDNRSVVPMQDIEKPTSRYQMVNKLFNYSEETSVNALSESATFKAMVAGGEILVKRLYENEYSMENKTKLIMAANSTPVSADKTHGFLRRLAIVHFNKTYTAGDGKHDYFIKDRLLAELPGICNRLIAAYKELKARGVLSAKEKLDANLRTYQAESDTVLMFIDAHMEFHDTMDRWVKFAELYEHYRAMCDMQGFKAMNATHFARQLKRHDPKYDQRKTRLRDAKGRYYVYRGVTLHKEF